MTMTTRRTFMQSLAALLASTPLLRSARGSTLPPPDSSQGKVAMDLTPPVIADSFEGLGIRDIAVSIDSTNLNTARLEFSAWVWDAEALNALTSASKTQELVPIDAPLLRSLGIANSLWVVEHLDFSAHVEAPVLVGVSLRCLGRVNTMPPSGEVQFPGMKGG